MSPLPLRSRFCRLSCVIVILAGAFAGLLAGPAPLLAQQTSDWPQWRGPARDGQLPPETPAWPDDLKNVEQVWRVELGPSYSGPVVVGDHVFVTETIDEKFEAVKAFDRATGKQLWSTQWEGSLSVPFFARENGDWIRSTPAVDGDRLYVAGMRDVLVCLNAATGETVWRLDFVEKFQTPLPAFGFVCSPLIDGDAVYVQAGASVFKLNKLTGEVIWRSLQDEGGMYGSAFSSPVIAELCGVRQLLVQARTKLASLNLETGDVLWSQDIETFQGMNILTPTVLGDGVFTSAYGGKSEFYAVTHTAGQGQNADAATGWQLERKWTNNAQAYMSSPIVIEGHAFMHLRSERAICLNLATGETTWTTKPEGKYWSMVANGGKLLALKDNGELLLLTANPQEFTLLDRKQVSEASTWAHLAIRGDLVFVRELNALTVWRWTAGK